MPYEFYLGIDAVEIDDEKQAAAALIEKRGDEGEPEYVLHSLVSYEDERPDDLVQTVVNLISGDPYVGRTVCVTNVGDDAGAELRRKLGDKGLTSITLTVTGGDSSSEQGQPLSFGDEGTHVSEHEVVRAIEEVYRSGRLDASAVKSDEPSALVRGLEDYHVSSGEASGALNEVDVRPSRSGTHSTLVLAAGVAVWLAEQQSFDPTEHLAGDPPPVREPKREMRPDTT